MVGDPALLYTLEAQAGVVTSAEYIAGDDVFITVSLDCSVAFWAKRPGSDTYYPCLIHKTDAPVYSHTFDQSSKDLFIGLKTGAVCHLAVAADYMSVKHVRTYTTHVARVTALAFDRARGILISCSHDKALYVHNLQTHRLFGSYLGDAKLTCLAYVPETNHIFVGSGAGLVVLLSCVHSDVKVVHSLDAHAGTVNALLWEPRHRYLVSAGGDERVVVWDIGGKKGISYELNKHAGGVAGVGYLEEGQELLSLGQDGLLVAWDMTVKRKQALTWHDSDVCQLCSAPFFWAVKLRLNVNRQHHCRRCGLALCSSCVPHKIPLPISGFENPVYLCAKCHGTLTPQDLASSIELHTLPPSLSMRWQSDARLLLTTHKDRAVRVWKLE